MDQETGELQCTVSYEELAPTGEVLKKTLSRNASLVLMRNEFKDVIFKATLAKKEMKFIIRDIVVHKKFVKDGKATVKFPDKKVQFMISNHSVSGRTSLAAIWTHNYRDFQLWTPRRNLLKTPKRRTILG